MPTTWTECTVITDPFTVWCVTHTATSSTTMSNVVWNCWTTTNVSTSYCVPMRAAEAQEEMHRLAVEKARTQQKEAEDRAEKLLLENLSLQQQLDYRERNYFVINGKSGRRYRIRRARSGNIDVIDKKGRVEHRLCAHPNEWVPDPDTNLAQKLMLEHDEEGFHRIANRHASFDRNTAVLEALH